MTKSGWTLKTLQEHLESQICSVDRRHSELAQERNKAVDIALTAQKEKAAVHNDLLGAMKDQAGQFYTKEQADMQTATFNQRLMALERHQIADQTKDKTIGGTAAMVMQLLTAATLVIAIIVYFANR
jgi:hemerythrin